MYDHDDDGWDPDITGDPMLDQTGYESPRRQYHQVRWDAVEKVDGLAQWHRDQQRKRERQERERQRRR